MKSEQTRIVAMMIAIFFILTLCLVETMGIEPNSETLRVFLAPLAHVPPIWRKERESNPQVALLGRLTVFKTVGLAYVPTLPLW